jgi:hypothetical protein
MVEKGAPLLPCDHHEDVGQDGCSRKDWRSAAAAG